MLDSAQKAIESAAKHLGLSDDEKNILLKSEAEHEFEIKVSNGNTYKAYRVQHNSALGPYKGGIRFHPEVNLEEVRALATLMSIKTAAAGLPLGGGKGGVAVNAKELSETELEEIAREYVKQLYPHIGPENDVPAPDVNTNAQIIDWMTDEYSKQTGDETRASFTGKSIDKGGSEGRNAATGRGGVISLKEVLKNVGKIDDPITMVVQGYGNVGSFFATLAQKEFPNWKLIAVTDSSGGPYNADGLDAEGLYQFKKQYKKLSKFEENDVTSINNDELLSLDTDVLVLAGLGDVIDEYNMKSVKAKFILELANGPVNDVAHDYLVNQGVTIIPDVLANAGGVIVSYLEWVQNRKQEQWSEEKVNAELERYMVKAIDDAYNYSNEEGVSLKEAAFSLAIKRILGR